MDEDDGRPSFNSGARGPRKILLIDDHPLFVAGIAYILRDLLGDVDLLFAATAAEARLVTRRHTDLDCIFCDYKLPDSDGLALLREFRDAMLPVPIIMVSAFDEVSLIDKALTLGASGFVSKSADKFVFRQCLEQVENGNIFLLVESKKQLARYRRGVLHDKRRVAESLSPRQHDVLLLIAKGYANSEIGKALGIAESTVKSHVSTLLDLLDSDNRVHCIAEARRRQLVV
jgi:DNA-binding NarL/FixJ family response regulator